MMLCIVTPGAFVSVYLQIAFKQSMLIWLPFVIAGVSQTLLLFMCIYYWWRNDRIEEKTID